MAEGLVGHDGAEIRSADADVDHVFDAFTGVALPFARADAVGKGGHFIKDGMHLWHDIGALELDRCGAGGAECGVENGAVLGRVDLVATEHRIDAVAEAGGIGQRDEIGNGLLGDDIFRVVEKEAGGFELELRGAVGVRSKEFAEVGEGLALGLEGLPGWLLGDVHAGWRTWALRML